MTTRTMSAHRPGATVDQWVLRVAGSFVLASLALSQIHSPYWLWFTGFVGANMLQASFTGFCPLAMILDKLGVPAGAAFCAARKAQGARSSALRELRIRRRAPRIAGLGSEWLDEQSVTRRGRTWPRSSSSEPALAAYQPLTSSSTRSARLIRLR